MQQQQDGGGEEGSGGGLLDGLPALGNDADNYLAVSNVNWRQGRHLLRQYLQVVEK